MSLVAGVIGSTITTFVLKDTITKLDMSDLENQLLDFENQLYDIKQAVVNLPVTDISGLTAELEDVNTALTGLQLQIVTGDSETLYLQLQEELETVKAELEYTRSLLSDTAETNTTVLVIPPPEIVGEIGWQEIEETLKEIVPNAGIIAGTHEVTTVEEIEFFLETKEWPKDMEEKAISWYLMSQFIEWGGPRFAIAQFMTFDLMLGVMDGVIIIAEDNDGEYKIFTIDGENRLIPFLGGSWQSFSATFP